TGKRLRSSPETCSHVEKARRHLVESRGAVAPRATTTSLMTTSNEERPRVLIVDDEKFIRDILADFLGMEGYVVRTAEDGQAALGELNHAHYDLVISDLKMPRMGGIELLEQIGTAAPNALTVIMTGFGTVETA